MNGAPVFGFAKADRRVSVYYFYLVDRDFGPGFIKMCSYFCVPGEGVGERARVGETSSRPGGARVHGVGMALTGALCKELVSVVGFTNKSLRGSVSSLLGSPYTQQQMTYDLRRLRLKQLKTEEPSRDAEA